MGGNGEGSPCGYVVRPQDRTLVRTLLVRGTGGQTAKQTVVVSFWDDVLKQPLCMRCYFGDVWGINWGLDLMCSPFSSVASRCKTGTVWAAVLHHSFILAT